MSKKVDSAFLCNLTNKYTIFPVVYPMQSEIELLQLSSEGVVDEDPARSRESKGTVGPMGSVRWIPIEISSTRSSFSKDNICHLALVMENCT